jgi:hypothetical protein
MHYKPFLLPILRNVELFSSLYVLEREGGRESERERERERESGF